MDISNAVGQTVTTKVGKLTICQFLGKGKSGYSYLAKNDSDEYVIKFMHYEPCSYYTFGEANKVELEVEAFNVLKRVGINVPQLLDVNTEENFLVKEYIDGDLVTNLIIKRSLPNGCIKQVFEMAYALKNAGMNIDYFPDNFVAIGDSLYYIDYEYNQYDENWDLVNWGLYYWANSAGMKCYKETKDACHINQSRDSGIPIKSPFDSMLREWCQLYG
ncbi:hypothetical protein [Photobacterium nomapromontoriensis]|uniref:hypothetical protein n=1 Tax=Photobacterium nomapromontoriensis TaxID=2910237 RepID=UPI003D0C597A